MTSQTKGLQCTDLQQLSPYMRRPYRLCKNKLGILRNSLSQNETDKEAPIMIRIQTNNHGIQDRDTGNNKKSGGGGIL